MSTQSNSPLRQRMTEDMNARRLTAGTQTGHLRACRRFAAFLKRSPDKLSLRDNLPGQMDFAVGGKRR